jgi:hypothetical protein
MSVFQTEDAGSIPAARSILFVPKQGIDFLSKNKVNDIVVLNKAVMNNESS